MTSKVIKGHIWHFYDEQFTFSQIKKTQMFDEMMYDLKGQESRIRPFWPKYVYHYEDAKYDHKHHIRPILCQGDTCCVIYLKLKR